jgi:fumarate reductase subunit C
MVETAGYTPHHPRWLRPHVSTYWWLARRSYLTFILREISSVFIAWFVVYLLLLLDALLDGPAAYDAFLSWSAHRLVLTLNVVTFLFAVFHAITWFNLAPQAMVVRLGSTRVPGWMIAASNYAAWVGVSALLLLLLMGTF